MGYWAPPSSPLKTSKPPRATGTANAHAVAAANRLKQSQINTKRRKNSQTRHFLGERNVTGRERVERKRSR